MHNRIYIAKYHQTWNESREQQRTSIQFNHNLVLARRKKIITSNPNARGRELTYMIPFTKLM
jgi:hypothetical protein